MSPKLKAVLQYGIITLIGVFFLYFVFRGTDWNELFGKLRHTNYFWIGIGLLVAMISHLIRAYRATMLYDVLGYHVPVKNSFYAVMIGYMMNYVIPRAGEVSRCAALSKTDDIPVNKSLGTVITERIFDMVILFAILAVVFLLQFDLLSTYLSKAFSNGNAQSDSSTSLYLKLGIAGAIVALAAVFFVVKNKFTGHPLYIKLSTMIKGFGEGLLSIKQVKKPGLFIVLSLGIWACYILMMYFCFFSMEATENLNFSACLTVFVIGTFGMVIPAPGAGAGTYHFAVMQALLLFSVPEEDGRAYATIVHGAQMVLFLIIGAVCSLIVLSMHKNKTAVQS